MRLTVHELHDSALRRSIYSSVGKDISYTEPSVASLANICVHELVFESLAGDELFVINFLFIFLGVSRLANILFLCKL